MTRRQTRRALLGLGFASLIGAVAVVVLGLLLPIAVPPPDSGGGATPGISSAAPRAAEAISTRGALELDALLLATVRDLRPPLFDPPPVAADTSAQKPATPTPPAISLRVVGTVIEPGRSMVILQLSDNVLRVVAKGDVIADNGAKHEIQAIEDHTVRVQVAGRLHTLPIPRLDGATP